MKSIFQILFIIISCIGCSSLKSKTKVQENPSVNKLEERALVSLLIEATTEKIIGNLEVADSLFKECLKIDNKNAVCFFELSGIYRLKNNPLLAIDYAEKAVKYDPENEWYKTNLALFYSELDQHDQARKLYEELIIEHPQRIEYLYSLSETYSLLNNHKKAIETLNILEEKIGLNENVIVHKHRLYLEIKDHGNAIDELNKLINSNPNDVRYYGLLAELYEFIGEKEKALEQYERILSIDPKNGYVHLSLFQYYMIADDTDKSFNSLKLAFESIDIDVDTKINMLLHVFNEIEIDDTIEPTIHELFEILLLKHNNNPKAYSFYADFLMQDNNLITALKYFKRAAEFDNYTFALWNEIIIIESKLLLYPDLEIDSKKAMELFPTQPTFYFFNGLANLKLKNLKSAIESFNLGKEFVLNDVFLLAEFYQFLGDSYHENNEDSLSDIAYEKTLSLDPLNIYVLNNYSYYLSLRGKKLDLAEEMILKAINVSAANANFYDTYGWILFLKANFIDAEIWIKKSLLLGGDQNGIILEHYGDVLYQLNRKSEAIEYWHKAELNGTYSEKLKTKISNEKYID